MSESRAERRRMERDLARTKPAEGLGLGWRRSTGPRQRPYPVKEGVNVPLETLIAESQAVHDRLNAEKRLWDAN